MCGSVAERLRASLMPLLVSVGALRVIAAALRFGVRGVTHLCQREGGKLSVTFFCWTRQEMDHCLLILLMAREH